MKKISVFLLFVLFISTSSFAQYNPGALDFNYPSANFELGVDYTGVDTSGNGYLNYGEIILDPNAPSGPNFHLFDELSNGKPILIDFYTPACGYCRTFTPIIEDVFEVHGSGGDNTLNIIGVCSFNSYGYEGYRGLYYFWESTVYSNVHPLMTDFPTNMQVADETGEAGVFDRPPYYINSWPRYIMVCPDRSWKFVEGWTVETSGQSYQGGPENLSDSIYSAACGCDPIATETNDALIYSYISPKGLSCEENITPKIKLQSRGTSELNSVDIIISINGTDVDTYHWTGSLNQYDMEEVTLNEIQLQQGDNTVQFKINNPNGNTDENPGNDIFTQIITVPENPASITVTFDFAYVSSNDFSWKIENQNTNEILFEKSFDNSYTNSIDIQDVCLLNDNCYNFIFTSNNGYGINSIPEEESLTVTDEEGTILVYLDENNAEGPGPGQPFIVTENFCLGNPGSNIQKTIKPNISVYPNPGNGNISINFKNNYENINLKVTDILGKVMFLDNNINTKRTYYLNINKLKKGIYNITLFNSNYKKVIKYIKI